MLCFVGYSNPDWEYLKLDHVPGYSILRIPFPAGAISVGATMLTLLLTLVP